MGVMTQGSYKQFCPVAMAAEVLCTRWTPVLIREMLVGSTRFNDLRRGVPRMSPALLSQRLKELEEAGIVERKRGREANLYEYHLTKAGRELEPIIMGFGVWGQRWIESELTLEHLDVQLLMWDMRRNLDPTPMPSTRSTIQFLYTDLPKKLRTWWVVVTPSEGVELCSIDPGQDVDLYVASDLRTMTAIWIGLDSVRKAVSDDRLILTGNRKLGADMQTWLGLSPFAKEKKLVA
jgi:DNA-binding HxlR family transcriptional regulator